MAIGGKRILLGRFQLHLLPVLVWLIALASVVVLLRYRVQRFEVVGLAQGQIRQIAATGTGRLKVLNVQLFEQVQRGRTVAALDDALIQARLATIVAEIERLQAELKATHERLIVEQSDRQANLITTRRRFDIDIEQTRLSILELKATLEPDKIMLQDLELEIKIVKELLDKQATTPYELQKVQVQYETLAKKIEENEHLLTQTQKDLATALERYEEFRQNQPVQYSPDSALQIIRKAINVQELLIEQLSIERQALVLKSPIDGVVSQILSRPGEAVMPGTPILTVTEVKPSEIIAYASEIQAGTLEEGMSVELVKGSRPQQIATSQVTYVGPVIEPIPARLWKSPNMPEWGRPFLIKVPPAMELLPGQRIGIRGL